MKDRMQREKDTLYHWACAKGLPDIRESVFNPDVCVAGTWFTPYTEGEDIRPYQIQSVPELKAQLVERWKDETELSELILPIAVAAFKGRPAVENGHKGDTLAQSEDVLPAYVYVF